MGPRAGLDGWKISSPPGFDPGPSSPLSVAIPTELPGPLYYMSSLKKISHFLLYMPYTFKSFYAQVVLSTTLLRTSPSPSPSCCYKTVSDTTCKCNNCTSCFLSMTSTTINYMRHYFHVASFLRHYRSQSHPFQYFVSTSTSVTKNFLCITQYSQTQLYFT